MDANLKAKWIEALRSGRYRKGKYRLKTGDQFCCLGVLCDLQGVDWSSGNQALRAYPPDGFSADMSFDQMGTLAGLNDCKNASFARIADHIEGHL